MARDHAPDRWRSTGSAGETVLFDMFDGLHPIRNVWGLSDPDVHWIDGRWTMFLGGVTPRLRVLLFTAALPAGAPLSCDDWSLVTVPGNPRRAAPVAPAPPKGLWDSRGMHTPSYVRGRVQGGPEEERIYYAGQSSRSVTGRKSRYSIGFLTRTPDGWRRHGAPVHVGTHERPSVMEPLVRYDDGLWRMWYLSTPHEVGRGEMPDYRLEYVEGTDGVTWSTPRVLFSTEDGYFDNAVLKVDDHYEMVVARGTNLHGTPDFPAQGLWWLRSPRPSGSREEWTRTPVRLLDTDVDPSPWFGDGGCGPSFHYGDTDADRNTMYVFFTGTRARTPWWKAALHRLSLRRGLPMPTPFHLATGRISLPGFRPRTGEDPPPSP